MSVHGITSQQASAAVQSSPAKLAEKKADASSVPTPAATVSFSPKAVQMAQSAGDVDHDGDSH